MIRLIPDDARYGVAHFSEDGFCETIAWYTTLPNHIKASKTRKIFSVEECKERLIKEITSNMPKVQPKSCQQYPPANQTSKYHRIIKTFTCSCGTRWDIMVDVYDVLGAFTGHYHARIKPMIDHLLKKLLAGGERGHKDLQQDLTDIIDTTQRAKETLAEQKSIIDEVV